jgi:hypothetical protein
MQLRNLTVICVKKTIGIAALFVAVGMSASPVMSAGDERCQNVTGKGVWTLIPAPNDPLGRILGPTTGTLKASTSAYLTSLAPNPDGSLQSTSVEVWALGPQDLIQFAGAATFTPIAGAPIGTVADSLTLTAVGGTGKYAGVTGTLHVTGTGYNLFGPAAGPGSSYFDIRYDGTICTVN